ncbi:MAG TPA: hypothetical protein VGT00_19500 [Methylomirabilota bacterium]|jgi:hypothetical protein|nr:hypothetical protein [Methylomirabilota bacterium]
MTGYISRNRAPLPLEKPGDPEGAYFHYEGYAPVAMVYGFAR